MDGIWTQNVAMHRWISLTTALEAERIWIVTLTVHDHTQTQPIPISEWRGRGGGEVWVVFVGVEGAERELVMVYLCLYWSRLFLCLWYCTWCVSLILTFQVIMLSSCFGDSIATHRLSKCKSPHHYHRGICFLPWIMVVFSGLTVFNGTYPVHYECHESTV